jgi:outer membrane protein
MFSRRNLLLKRFAWAFLAFATPFAPLKVNASDSLEKALANAYINNPTLNAERAALRGDNEVVSRRMAGYRPQISASGEIGAQYNDLKLTRSNDNYRSQPKSATITATQTLFDGNRTTNLVSSAESLVYAQRETLRETEGSILVQGATAYMDVLRDTALYDLRTNNVEVLEEQLRQVNDRFRVGEVTRTDVAQAEARFAGARSQASAAQATLKSTIGRFRQIIGVEPKKLQPAKSIEKLLPKNLDVAVATATGHPAIQSQRHTIDSAELDVRAVTAEFYPTISLVGSASRRYESQQAVNESTTASITGRLNVPLYEGGDTSSRVRQGKERVGELRTRMDITREQVRANVVRDWSRLASAKTQIDAAQAQVRAAEVALNGVREEAKVGQRTTLDVLNAQQELLDARVNLVIAQRDRVVTSYDLLQSLGILSAERLSLKTALHNPSTHFEQVRGKWGGTMTPDGQ